jgi:hypothetical protein
MLILLLVLTGLFELPDELFLAVLLLWTISMAVMGRLLMKWRTKALQEQLQMEKGAELPKEAPPLFQALIDDYMQNDLATLTDLLQPLGWTTDYPPADVEGCIVTDYEKGEHELYLEFSADEIQVTFDEATANIVEVAPLDMARFADARAVYDYVASLCEHYFP